MSSVDAILREAIPAAVSWWIDGLWMGLPKRWRRRLFRERDRVFVYVETDAARIEVRSGCPESPERDTFEISLQDTVAAASSLRARCAVTNADVFVILPAGTALTKLLSLPESTESALNHVVRHELDRLLPVPIDEFVFSHTIEGRDTSSTKIHVRASLIHRNAFSEWLSKLAPLDLEPHVVTVANTDGSWLCANFIKTPRRLRLPFVEWPCNLVAAGATLLALLIALYVPLGRYGTMLEDYERAVAETREQAIAARSAAESRAGEIERGAFLDSVRGQYASPLVLLEKLSETLPDRAWVTRLRLTDENVELQGEATQASSLLELVAEIDVLEDVEFEAPVSMNPASGKEQFSIVAQIEQPSR